MALASAIEIGKTILELLCSDKKIGLLEQVSNIPGSPKMGWIPEIMLVIIIVRLYIIIKQRSNTHINKSLY